MEKPNIFVHYQKIEKCIYSCQTIQQLFSSDNMIDTFYELFKENNNRDLLWRKLNVEYLIKTELLCQN